MMSVGKKISLVMIISVLMVSVIAASAAAETMTTPILPHAFYGKATINGRQLPAGSVIQAFVSDADGYYHTTDYNKITTSAIGSYGNQNISDGARLDVHDGPVGGTIIFRTRAPGMTNALQAQEQYVFEQGGGPTRLDLTFTGEEMYASQTPPAGAGGAGGSGPSGGAATGSGSQPGQTGGDQATFQPEGKKFIIIFENGTSVSLSAAKDDVMEFTLDGKQIEVKVKSMSDFAVLLSIGDNDIGFLVNETKGVDLDGDGFDDVSITLERIKSGKAEMAVEQLKKPATITGTFTKGFTGMLTMNQVGTAVIIIIIIVALGVLYTTTFRRRLR